MQAAGESGWDKPGMPQAELLVAYPRSYLPVAAMFANEGMPQQSALIPAHSIAGQAAAAAELRSGRCSQDGAKLACRQSSCAN